MAGAEQLERQLAMLDFTINVLASRTSLCGPGQSISQADREAYIRSQEQLDSLIIEYDQTRRLLLQATALPQPQQQQQQHRRMTIG